MSNLWNENLEELYFGAVCTHLSLQELMKLARRLKKLTLPLNIFKIEDESKMAQSFAQELLKEPSKILLTFAYSLDECLVAN